MKSPLAVTIAAIVACVVLAFALPRMLVGGSPTEVSPIQLNVPTPEELRQIREQRIRERQIRRARARRQAAKRARLKAERR